MRELVASSDFAVRREEQLECLAQLVVEDVALEFLVYLLGIVLDPVELGERFRFVLQLMRLLFGVL